MYESPTLQAHKKESFQFGWIPTLFFLLLNQPERISLELYKLFSSSFFHLCYLHLQEMVWLQQCTNSVWLQFSSLLHARKLLHFYFLPWRKLFFYANKTSIFYLSFFFLLLEARSRKFDEHREINLCLLFLIFSRFMIDRTQNKRSQTPLFKLPHMIKYSEWSQLFRWQISLIHSTSGFVDINSLDFEKENRLAVTFVVELSTKLTIREGRDFRHGDNK